jgi:hypothetical protein
MGPLVAGRRVTPFRNSIATPNQAAAGCGISETPELIFQRDHPVSRGSRAEYLYTHHWLHTKEALQLQKLEGTPSHINTVDDSEEAVEIKFCGQKTVQKGMSLQTISELGAMELEVLGLHQSPLEAKRSTNASPTHLLEDAKKPRRVGQRLSELASKNIKMEADLVLLAEHGKVCYLPPV